MSFADGDLYERSFETPAGTINVLAGIVVAGRRIELLDIAVYPRSSTGLTVPPSELLGWARLALSELADAGFDELRVTGTRLTGARLGRRLDLTVRLRKEDPRAKRRARQSVASIAASGTRSSRSFAPTASRRSNRSR